METKEVMYTNSKGETTPISTLNTEHIINSLAKEYRTIFESHNKDDLSSHLSKINDLKEEYHKRLNEFVDKLGD